MSFLTLPQDIFLPTYLSLCPDIDFPENVPDMKFCHSLYCKTQADFNFTILIAMDPKYKIAELVRIFDY